MTTFGLIHGAWHSSWWWGPVAERLRAAGHEVVAIDLPCDDPEVLFTGYADIVTQSLAGAGDDVVLVASSLAGLSAPLVAARRPVREIVLVGALLPTPGRSFADQLRAGETRFVAGALDSVVREGELTRWPDASELVRVLYHDVDPAIVREAIPRLRAQAVTPYREPCPLDAWPDVPVRSIVCAGDRLVPPDWSRAAARERLGIETIELPGGHAPMIARPGALAEIILA